MGCIVLDFGPMIDGLRSTAIHQDLSKIILTPQILSYAFEFTKAKEGCTLPKHFINLQRSITALDALDCNYWCYYTIVILNAIIIHQRIKGGDKIKSIKKTSFVKDGG